MEKKKKKLFVTFYHSSEKAGRLNVEPRIASQASKAIKAKKI